MGSSSEILVQMERLVEELCEFNSEFPVIVEGRNDFAALRKLGLGGEIIVLNGRHTIIEMCEEISRDHKQVAIMTDWDRKGGQLCRMLSNALNSSGVKSIEYLRARISSLTGGDIKDVESLPSFMERLKKKSMR